MITINLNLLNRTQFAINASRGEINLSIFAASAPPPMLGATEVGDAAPPPLPEADDEGLNPDEIRPPLEL